MNFNEILNDLLIERETDILTISKETGIANQILYHYTHDSTPNIDHAVTLANHFNCTLNFLFGLEDEPNSYKFKSTYDITLFSNRYDDLLKENKISHYKLSKEYGLNYSSHYNWQRGIAEPSLQSLMIIARYFDVSIDYLVGRSDNKYT